jgi:acyl-[acyl-carrier-protein]-phospholipid O-acyltransferase/long-chain-fatty-acid--[acyl-carrier-protein] ligase
VLTAHRFIEQGKLHDLSMRSRPGEITYLEDVRATIGLADKLFAAAAGLPRAVSARRRQALGSGRGPVHLGQLRRAARRGAEPGQPGRQRRQIAAHIELDRNWVFFNPLPDLPLLRPDRRGDPAAAEGMKAFQYPSPLHAKQIPPLLKVTPGLDPVRHRHLPQPVRPGRGPDELAGLKFIVCGAEKVRDETHNLINDKFGAVPVLEGYGATEAAPVIAVNNPDDNRRGTVGGLLPGIEYAARAGRGHPGGGRCWCAAPTSCRAISRPDGGVDPPTDGWHDTGDVVDITDDGWITILGRVKRFAKIGGEMVSLTAAEDLASAVWPDGRHAVISMPDPRRARSWCWSPTARTPTVGPPGGPRPRPSARRNWRCRARSSRSPRSRCWAPARPTMSPSSGWSTRTPRRLIAPEQAEGEPDGT